MVANNPYLHWPEGLRLDAGGSWIETDGSPVTDSQTLQRLQSLAIPPAWQHVWAARDPQARIQARGIDGRGRVQYIYSAQARELAEKNKYEHMLHYARQLPALRADLAAQLRRRPKTPDADQVTALVVRLLDLGLFRVGTGRYVRENHTYGLTTLEPRHVSVKGSAVSFDFVGKEHLQQVHTVDDRAAATVMGRLLASHAEAPRQFLFTEPVPSFRRISSATVNTYIHARSGAHSSAKVTRTWGATVIAAAVSAGAYFSSPKKHRDQDLVAFEAAAHVLGNTPTMARNSYVHPHAIHVGKTEAVQRAVDERIAAAGSDRVESVFTSEAVQEAVLKQLLDWPGQLKPA